MKPLSIVMLISPGEAWGGIEQHILDLSLGLKKRGHTITFATRRMEHANKRYAEAGENHFFPIRNSLDLETIFGVAALLREKKADIVHTHTSRDAWMALFATMVAGRGKAVTTRHGPFPAKRDVLHYWFYNKLAAIICVSRYVKAGFLSSEPKVPDDKLKVIYPGIDIDKYLAAPPANIRGALGIGPEEFVIGAIGRISVGKGIHDAIRAVSILRARNKPCRLVVVGQVNPVTPEYMDELRQLVVEENIEDSVHFYGFSTNVAGIIKDMDTVVLASNIPEASPLALREAMVCGKPVVSTDTGGQVEIVEHGFNGFLVPPNSPGAIADALAKMIDDADLRKNMGLQAQRMAVDKFSQMEMLKETEQCYLHCLSRP